MQLQHRPLRAALATTAGVCVLAACGSSSSGNQDAGSHLAVLTFQVQATSGTTAPPSQIGSIERRLDQRLQAAGVHNASVSTSGDTIIVRTPVSNEAVVHAVSQRGVLRFRQVLAASTAPPQPSPAPVAGGYGAALQGSESPTLTAAFLRSFHQWDCRKDNNPTGGSDPASDYTIGCDSDGVAYLLAPAALEGSDVGHASAGLAAQAPNDWVVNLQFTHHGAGLWLALTKKTYEVTHSSETGFGSCHPPKGCNAIGIVLDGVVASAPVTETDGIPGGLSQISGQFTEDQAAGLAAVLESGVLPLPLRLLSETSPNG